MNTAKNIYRVTRSVLFTAIILVAAAYLIIYILLSTPPIQNKIREIAETEASKFIGGDVRLSGLMLKPFNEVAVTGLDVYAPDGEKCLHVDEVGAGINLWRLVSKGEIEITYGEIIGLDAAISQKEDKGPLNIQYIIDAFSPKQKNRPSAKFDLKLRNVVLRRCRASFDKEWIPEKEGNDKIDFNHLSVTDIKADITFPRLSNDDLFVDLRRLSFKVSEGPNLEKLSFRAHLTEKSISINNLTICLPSTKICPSDIEISGVGFKNIKELLTRESFNLVLDNNMVNPADFGWLVPQLRYFNHPMCLSVEASGNASRVDISKFALTSENYLSLSLSGSAHRLDSIHESNIKIDDVKLNADSEFVADIMNHVPNVSRNVRKILANCGDIGVSATGQGNLSDNKFTADCELKTVAGRLFISASASDISRRGGYLKGEVISDNLNVAKLLGGGKIGKIKSNVLFDTRIYGKDISGFANGYISDLEFNGANYGGVVVEVSKEKSAFAGNISIDNEIAKILASASGNISGEESGVQLQCDVSHLIPSIFGILPEYEGYELSGNINANLSGNNLDNLLGEIRLSDFKFEGKDKCLTLDSMALMSSIAENEREVSIHSDWVDGVIDGHFKFMELPNIVQDMLSGVFPSLVAPSPETPEYDSEVEFSFLVKSDNEAPDFFNLPFRLLVPIPISGTINGNTGTASLSVDVPYIQQGKNKLVRDSRINANIDGKKGLVGLEVASTFPAKKGDLALDFRVWGEREDLYADIGWKNPDNDSFKGLLSIGANVSRDELSANPEVTVAINPSIFDIGSAKWNIDKGSIVYDDNILTVTNFKLWHDSQFVEIDGVASALPGDSLTVRLADIDLDYIFDLLKINYVTFGGTATGELVGKSLLSKSPEAMTDNLIVKDLSYNGSVLGDGFIKSRWDNEDKEVTIYADIMDNERRRAVIDGGIWVARDSLSFEIDADKVPVDFLKPFMQAFTSDVRGKASGNAKLFGTFSDIDLTGKIFADSIAMKLDFTNTWYHGSDSVYLHPGRIEIPSFRLYDKNGNSAILTGHLTHRYFHEPRFNFRISDARRLLCYDTNARMNPDWYGTIYGDGSAVVKGWPGIVAISVDMDIVGNSTFTFALNDTQAAEDYHFLTFSDRRKEEEEKRKRDAELDLLASFKKQIEEQNDNPSVFSIDIRASVNPSSLMTLVMDPVAGDKINARGNGAIQMEYESDSDELLMFGKYTLDEGNYNFSLQDLILRDFTIRPGSSISFNGDPLNADLNITASYRVNTNLSDLDKSFSTDRDLARTNVPVDALLMVNGEMQRPDISFDIELPTLTQDVERKVKSIVSTDDMMSRQIIYLLALNRFYTPEYMGTTGNGGELAAVASTTLSSQLSSMLGQLTDKFTLAPSFRSDKGDFSDIEVDVALSSRLLNNRLLVNGNFGYRDRNTSTTTFVGDFDIEYLLNKRGDLRLKAYNHFNDQNYYLREALTTQGIGVVYRRDFNNPFLFLKRKKKKSPGTEGKSREEQDSLSGEHNTLSVDGEIRSGKKIAQ